MNKEKIELILDLLDGQGERIDIVGLPDYMDIYNGGEKCDMAIGPCSCGAWHYRGEDR